MSLLVLAAAAVFTSANAQYRNDRNDDRYERRGDNRRDDRDNDRRGPGRDGYNNYGYERVGDRYAVYDRPYEPRFNRPAQPSRFHVWINADWFWNNNRYEYRPGYWAQPRRNQVWVDGRWERAGRGWVWIPGYWTKMRGGRW